MCLLPFPLWQKAAVDTLHSCALKAGRAIEGRVRGSKSKATPAPEAFLDAMFPIPTVEAPIETETTA